MSELEPNVSDPTFWQALYQAGRYGWDIGRPAPPLAHWLAGAEAPAPGRRVAVLGCGRGHDALLFARAGHNVTGFDFAPAAVSAAREHARAASQNVRFCQADIFALPSRHAGSFDLVVEHNCFSAIQPSRRTEFVAVVREILIPGGELVGVFFCHGRTDTLPFTTSREELEHLFAPHFAVRRLETAGNSIPDRANQELLVVMQKLS